jgi:hemerythrin
MLERNKDVSALLLHEQHLQLYRLVEQLDSAITEGVGARATGSTLNALEEYTKVHFGDEEELMMIHGYHSLRAHRAEHNALAVKLVAAREEYEAGKIDVLASLAHYLHSWLTDHIEGWDREFHQFLNARGLH